jgi:two-component system LytT family response regulator
MIEAIIVEDEESLALYLQQVIREVAPFINIRAVCNSVQSANQALQTMSPSILFLDVMLPDGTGFDLLKQQSNHSFEVIFTTAHNDFLLDAFKHAAAGYVLKPINAVDLTNAISAVMKRVQAGNHTDTKRIMELIGELSVVKNKNGKLAIPTDEGYVFVQIRDIIRLESSKGYTWIYLTQNKKYLSSYNIGEFLRILPSRDFIQIHKSHIVSIQFIHKYNAKDSTIEMDDHSTIPVSRRMRKYLLEQFSKPGRDHVDTFTG